MTKDIKDIRIKKVIGSRGDSMNGRMIIIKSPFKCSHLEKGFQGIDSFIAFKGEYYRLRYNVDGLFITPVEVDEKYNRFTGNYYWTRLPCLELYKYINPRMEDMTSLEKTVLEMKYGIQKYFKISSLKSSVGSNIRIEDFVRNVYKYREYVLPKIDDIIIKNKELELSAV